ncbi:MAG: hypothetical protein LBT80_07970 [Lactobacillaceae bacterium]|jgi:hypothetical protein|nr:hypothetical protein [Lactobacillaceae bacterium]
MKTQTQLDFTFVNGSATLHLKVGNAKPGVTGAIVESVGKALVGFAFLLNNDGHHRFKELKAVDLVGTTRTGLYPIVKPA